MPEKRVEKIVCGVTEPKGKQRRGTMKECAEMKQVRYYGIKKVDKIIVDKMKSKKKVPKITLEEAIAKTVGLKQRLEKLKKMIDDNTRVEKMDKVQALKKEYETVKQAYNASVPITNKMVRERKLQDEKAAKKTTTPTSKKKK